MLQTLVHRGEIYATFRSCGLSPKQSGNLFAHLSKIERCRGPKAVVNVLKERYHALLDRTSMSYKVSQKDNLWCGPFKPLDRLSQSGLKGLERALAVCKLTGYYVHPEATLDDYLALKKRLISNPDPFIGSEPFPLYKKRVDGNEVQVRTYFPVSKNVRNASKGVKITVEMDYPQSGKRAVLAKDNKSLPESAIGGQEHIDSLNMFPALVDRHYAFFSYLVGKRMPDQQFFHELAEKDPYDVAGRVVLLTKDRGMKLRPVANCNRMLQLACTPLHEYLKQVLRQHESVFIFDQDEGVEWTRNILKQGRRVSSIDLDSASDNIPLSMQRAFARNLCSNPIYLESLDIFCELSRMHWLTPNVDPSLKQRKSDKKKIKKLAEELTKKGLSNKDKKVRIDKLKNQLRTRRMREIRIQWLTGTPMGAKGSYYLFTLFLVNLFESLGGEGKYAIVGDDIVLESSLTSIIVEALQSLNIPLSTAKSFFDNSFAEFCGRVIDKSGRLRVYKAAPLDVINDPFGKVRQLGLKAMKHFIALRKLGKWTKHHIRMYKWLRERDLLDTVKELAPIREPVPSGNLGGLTLVQLGKDIKSTNLISAQQYQLLLDVERLRFLNDSDLWKILYPLYGERHDQIKEFLHLFIWHKPSIVDAAIYNGPNETYRLMRDAINNNTTSLVDKFLINSNPSFRVERARHFDIAEAEQIVGKLSREDRKALNIDLNTSAIALEFVPEDSVPDHQADDGFSEEYEESTSLSYIRTVSRAVNSAVRNAALIIRALKAHLKS